MNEAATRRWYHTIDLADGTSTPGVFDTRAVARRLPWPPALVGGRCLDVGTCDGFWAFEMERRGAAEVVAIDVDDPRRLDWSWSGRVGGSAEAAAGRGTPRRERFEVARAALGSRTTRVDCSVYDLDPAVHGRFDVVFCGSVLAHLREPVRALERLREVCAGQVVLIEPVDARLDIRARRVPCARLAAVPDQWWRANRAGLLALLRVAGFETPWVSRPFLTPFGPGAVGPPPARLGPRAMGRTLAHRLWRWGATIPVVANVAGLAFGTYDIAVLARPRPGGPAPVEGRG